MVWWLHWGRHGFVRKSFREDVIFHPSLGQRASIYYMRKKWEKRKTEDKKLVRKEFGRNDFLFKDMKALCASFFICISRRRSLTVVLQWNPLWCWWNDNWAITKIHEHFPMENPHKICCFSQIHEPIKQRAYKEKHLCSWM